MPKSIWKFFKRRLGDKHRDPVSDEFFNNESIADDISAFVREVVQNILDATRDKKLPAKVRFFVSGLKAALTPEEAAPYLEGIWPHAKASLPDSARWEKEPCRYLVVEDSNTTGLRGDHTAYEEPPDDEVNDFFYFFRAEGKSGKTGAKRGRWGIGKFVFPRASEIRAFFGLTVRDGNGHKAGPLLIGQAVAKNHKVDGTPYMPDGWWSRLDKNEVPVPFEDGTLINEFRSTWNVTRADDETGLSVVIPYVEEDFTADKLVRAVAEDYFIAILTEELVGVVESGEGPPVEITKDTLTDIIATIPGAKADELKANAALVAEALAIPEDQYIRVESQPGAPGWKAELIPADGRERMKTALGNGEIVAVRVPVMVGRKKGPRTESHLDVYFKPEHGHRGSAIFAREGLIVPGVKCAVTGVRAVVLVREENLARMLGDAEGPAHIEWTARGTKFKGLYDNGRDWLAFIKKAPAEILRITRGDEEEEDASLAADLFSVPAGLLGAEVEDDTDDDSTGSGGRPTVRPGVKPVVVPDDDDDDDDDDEGGDPPPPRRRIAVSALDDGFAVELAGEGADVPSVRLTAAYDVRRGNPFKKWRQEDFKLSDLPNTITGGVVTTANGNTMTVVIDDQDDFRLTVTGFDPNRDLKVRARRGDDT